MIRFWLLALRNLRRNLKRNIATGSAIALGFAGIIVLAGYSHRFDRYLSTFTIYVNHTGHLAIFAKDGLEKSPYDPAEFSLNGADQALIESVLKSQGNVEFFEGQIRGQGLVGNGCLSLPFYAQGYDPLIDKKLKEHEQVKEWMRPSFEFFLKGNGLWNYPNESGPVLLSKGLALALGKTKVHDEVANEPVTLANCKDPLFKDQMNKDASVQLLSGTWDGALSAVDSEMVGLFSTGFQEADNSAIFAPAALLQKLFDTPNFTQYSIWLKDPGRITQTLAELNSSFKAAGKEFEILRWNEKKLSPFYAGSTGFINAIVISVALILMSIVSFSILNSVTMTVLERAQEIGAYRAMGFRKAQVCWLYVQESVWLSVIASGLGLALGLAATFLINSAKIIYHPPGISGGLQLILVFQWQSALASFLAIVGVVIITTFFVASNRLKLTSADLLGGVLR
ncbi:MAG: ABC transporter permease [Bdellovibrionota bacterium]